MIIELKSKVLRIKEIKKKTRAAMFKDLQKGDCIQLFTTSKGPGRSYTQGTYAKGVRVVHIGTDAYADKSFNELENILNNFELEVVREG